MKKKQKTDLPSTYPIFFNHVSRNKVVFFFAGLSNLGKNILILKKNAFLFIVLLSFPVKSTRFEMPSRKKIGRPKGKNHSNECVIMIKNL